MTYGTSSSGSRCYQSTISLPRGHVVSIDGFCSSYAIERLLTEKWSLRLIRIWRRRIRVADEMAVLNDKMADRPRDNLCVTIWVTYGAHGLVNWAPQLVNKFGPNGHTVHSQPAAVLLSASCCYFGTLECHNSKMPFSTFRLPHSGGHFLKKFQLLAAKSVLWLLQIHWQSRDLSFDLSLK